MPTDLNFKAHETDVFVKDRGRCRNRVGLEGIPKKCKSEGKLQEKEDYM